LAGGDSLLFDPGFLGKTAVKGNSRLPNSALVSDERSMREGSVGSVSGEPLFVPDERREEAPVERPREETEPFSVSRGTEDTEARFAIGCAMSVTETCHFVGVTEDAGGDAELNAPFRDLEVGPDDVRMGIFTPTALARLLIL
jgi:hypothetical protein